MNNLFISTLLIGVVILAFFVAPVIIGVYIYRHAVSHNLKNPIRWALITGLTPLYIGLIIYLFRFESTDESKDHPSP